ncbi:MAG: dihydropteroate synthase [Rhodospirillales bacterium]|nr:dihydropteroate synthase [Rhodospirillales bacterium]
MSTRSFAGLELTRPLVMGVINVTPDSFSDGGDAFRTDDAVARGLALMEQGATILDVGGESTRPGADPVSEEEEIARVVPVIRTLVDAGAVVSIDTRHAAVMEAAIAAGATIVNDVTALTGDARSLDVVVESGVSLVLMHMQGMPETMQQNPQYDDVVGEVMAHLDAQVSTCEVRGVVRSEIAIDPGIGFGKTIEHNLALLKSLEAFQSLGCPLVLGVSRKSMIARLSKGEEPKDRVAGSVAAALAGISRGADIIRVHDVAETCQAIAVWQAIENADTKSK